MLRSARLFASLFLCTSLVSCSTNKTAIDDDAQQKIKTSQINTQLGIAYLQRNNIQRAKQKLLLALDQAPETPEPWYTMGYFLEATGNKTDANTYYLRAIAIAPTRGDVQNNYGTYLCRSGQYRASIDHFMIAVKDSNYLDPADAYENAGMCALKIPDNRRARKYLGMALAQDPSRSNALLGLAQLNYNIGNYPAAKRELSNFLTVATATPQSTKLSQDVEKKLAALTSPPNKTATIVATAAITTKQHPLPVSHHTPTTVKKMAHNNTRYHRLMASKRAMLANNRSKTNKEIIMSAIHKVTSKKSRTLLAAKKSKIV